MENIQLFQGDCLEVMKQIPETSVDMVMCDLPYGTTACKWDSIIPVDKLWLEYHRVCKAVAAMVFTASQPFTSILINSNMKDFRYQWVWDKVIPSGMTYARFQPMRQHEDILIFGKERPLYVPQMITRDKPIKSGGQKRLNADATTLDKYKVEGFKRIYDLKNPTTIICFMKVRKGSVHPTQKPTELMEYLIRTYTNEGDTVLDNCMGSGTTGVACVNTGRKFIGIELDPKYFEIAKQRIEQALIAKESK